MHMDSLFYLYIFFKYNSFKLKVFVKTFYLYQTAILTSTARGMSTGTFFHGQNVQEDCACDLKASL